MTEAFANAKVNLTLHITGQRSDGYHQLDSLVVFTDVGDRLWFQDANRMSIEVSGRFAEGVPADERNLVWRAAEAAGANCRIKLEKNLPHGAGGCRIDWSGRASVHMGWPSKNAGNR